MNVRNSTTLTRLLFGCVSTVIMGFSGESWENIQMRHDHHHHNNNDNTDGLYTECCFSRFFLVMRRRQEMKNLDGRVADECLHARQTQARCCPQTLDETEKETDDVLLLTSN